MDFGKGLLTGNFKVKLNVKVNVYACISKKKRRDQIKLLNHNS